MKKRIGAFTLSLLMLLSGIGIFPAEAFAADNTVKTAVQTVEYGDRFGKPAAVTSVEWKDSLNANYTYQSNTYYGDEIVLEKQMRDALVAHQNTISFRYATTENLVGYSYSASEARQQFMLGMINGSTSETLSESTKDGDYIRWQFGGNISAQFRLDYQKSSVNYYSIAFYGFNYYSSLAQESQVDAYVQNYVASINRNAMSDYALIKKIHDDVCNMTVYDEAFENRSDYYDYSAYGCMILGRCVCQGYALAFYRLCKEMGLQVRFVYSDPDWGCHAWNIVNLGGKFYYVDCTWDDTYSYDKVTYNFFLKNEDEIKAYDSRLGEHTLQDSIYSDSDFVSNYIQKIDTYSYNPNMPNLGNVTFSMSESAYTYDGWAHAPVITGTMNGKPFNAYTVGGQPSATNAGTYTIVLRGIYDDSVVTRTFVIYPRSIDSLPYQYNGKTTYTYNGSSIKPTIHIYGLNASDYSVTYQNNNAVGKGTVTAKGYGNYTGTITKSFTINPGAVKNFKVSKRGTDTLTFSWTKQPGVSGYLLQQKKDGKWKTVKKITSASTVSYQIKSLSAAKTYSFRIRAYKGSVNGAYKNYTTSTAPKKVGSLSVKAAKKSATVKWKKVSGNGYQLQYSTNSNFKNAKSVNLSSASKTSKKISGLKKGKKYYVRVRAVKTRKDSSGKTYKYYGSWSAKKSFKAK